MTYPENFTSADIEAYEDLENTLDDRIDSAITEYCDSDNEVYVSMVVYSMIQNEGKKYKVVKPIKYTLPDGTINYGVPQHILEFFAKMHHTPIPEDTPSIRLTLPVSSLVTDESIDFHLDN